MENDASITQWTQENLFPYTKFRPPQPGSNVVMRPRLQAALADATAQHRLTLVAAPAGSGKTILASTLAQSNVPALWIALDATDDDLATFIALLATALQNQLGDKGQAILNLLQTVPNLPEKTPHLAAILINQFQPTPNSPTILILDDYHVITDPAIHQFLAYLLDYLPPFLRLVIVSRHDPPLPLPRLRARNHLAEIRLPHLSFDDEETARFFNQRHNLHLNAGEVAALQRQTEGWVAALQLLASTLSTIQDEQERAAYIDRLNPADRPIFALLAQEVLAHQPPDIQEFLLQTSILPHLTPANCQAITQNDAAPRLLSQVYERNLFLTALTPDALSGPFRYHDLFRDFLQEHLKAHDPEQWLHLHRRAAQAALSDEQQLHHLTSAGLWTEAAQLLEAMAQLDSERRFTRSSVVNGIKSLPEEVRLAHPWLLLFVAQFYAVRGQLEAANPWRTQAAARFQATGDEMGEIELLMISAMVDTADSDKLITAFRQKVASSGHLMRPDQWAIYHGGEVWHALAQYDWPTVAEHTQANIRRALQSNDPGVLAMISLTLGPQLLFSDGGMAAIEAFAGRSLQLAGREDWILQLCAQGLQGAVRFFQGRLDEAEQANREAHRLLDEIGGLAWIDHHVCWVILAQALVRRAYRYFDDFLAAQAPRWQTQDTAAVYQQGILYLQGRSLWLRGRTAEVQLVLAQMEASQTTFGYETEDAIRRLLLAGLIAIETGDTAAATRDLRRAADLHRQIRHTVMLTHPRLALATLYGRQSRWEQALDELHIVLAEVKRWRLPGIMLQEGESIVPVLVYALKQGIEPETLQPLLKILQPDETSTIPLPHSNAYLTPRESEVLRMLATGATNRAIAAELVVTERTVKAHVTRILTKLEAATRTEAVSTARRLGLI